MQRDLQRIEHIRLRRRMMYGQHEQDIKNRIAESLSSVRRAAWGRVDMSSNVFKRIHEMMGALYNEEPIIYGPASALAAVSEQLDEVGYWTKMRTLQRDVSAFREMLMLVEPTAEGVKVLQVTPDDVDVHSSPRDPDDLQNVKWWHNGSGSTETYYIEYEPASLTYRAVKGDRDISDEILGGNFSGEAYPFRNALGQPVMPWIIYRAEDTGSTFNSWTGREAVECTLQLGLLYTYFSHVIRNSAWAQRYILNAIPLGAEIEEDDDIEIGTSTRARIDSDPSTVLMLKSIEGQQAQIGGFSSPVDPAKVIEAIRMYEERAMESILGNAVTKNDSDIRSGYSLAVSREESQKVQRSFLPLFRRSDRKLLNMVSQYLGYNTSLKDWDVKYPAVMTDEERIASGLVPEPKE
jgi:hypothetical protein